MLYDSYTMPHSKWDDVKRETPNPRPPIRISTNEARQQFATVVLLAAMGHEVTITRYGKPLVTMTSAISPVLRTPSEPSDD